MKQHFSVYIYDSNNNGNTINRIVYYVYEFAVSALYCY